MRITMQSVHNKTLRDLNNLTTSMSRVNSQISSGKQISTISQDPVNLITALGLRSTLTQITTYQDNLTFGDKSISAAESALTQMKDLTLRAKVLGLQQANATVNTQNRASAAEEVRHLWEEAITLANSDVNGKYIFGGYRTTGYTDIEPEPFVADLTAGYHINGQPLPALAAAAPTQYNLNTGDLAINGLPIDATVADADSTAHADASAAAKASAINAKFASTGVRADITPANKVAAGAVTQTLPLPPLTNIASGDLLINGQDIFDGVTNPAAAAVLGQDSDNTLVNAINAHSATTGVIASRDSSGILSLTAVDGRNIEVATNANGEAISQLNGAAGDTVYFGTVQLSSNQPFSLQTTPITEPGLVALGLDGGTAITGESSDTVGDGLLTMITIQKQDGNVRYAGDPDHDLAIKVGKISTLEVAKNGKTAVLDTGIFAMLKKLEDSLLGEKFSSVTGLNKATDTTAKLDSGNTGLEKQDTAFTSGTIAFTVTDHSTYPPTNRTMDIGIALATDSPADIAARINGIPGMTASWNSDGYLKLETTDTERYSFTYTDTSNFLEMSGITPDTMQVQSINKAVDDANTVMDNLSTQVSDFGARVNRIMVQQQIYSKLELATTENLSEKEDTDFTKALLELKSKETAYEAALAAAAKTMQMSLLDFLK
ncbi:flagellin N-terminal helical domain-containing protein [Thiovibrio frasassiensis]|uniref:Flagellin N-terminal domain-containing protein n=1 Tax=Thiovibrio frasassiensis TaxID=2984131 RepID=A0A9X4RLY3_9BACT|nr:hypothetical protein [Thiovibrio frasassiensis]MDG4475835.1 hypothetical protein [Thiovibrio frasassiensis]